MADAINARAPQHHGVSDTDQIKKIFPVPVGDKNNCILSKVTEFTDFRRSSVRARRSQPRGGCARGLWEDSVSDTCRDDTLSSVVLAPLGLGWDQRTKGVAEELHSSLLGLFAPPRSVCSEVAWLGRTSCISLKLPLQGHAFVPIYEH